MVRCGLKIAAGIAGLLVAAAGVVSAAAGDPNAAITVIGNRHVGADMIRSFFYAAPSGQYDAGARDDALKRLYATGLFADVKISHDGNRILVVVAEIRPSAWSPSRATRSSKTPT